MTRPHLPLYGALVAAAALTACGTSNPAADGQALPAENPSHLQGTVAPRPPLLGAMLVEINTETLAFRTELLQPRQGQDRGDVVDTIDLTYYFTNPVFCLTGDCIALKSVGLDNEGGTLTTPLVTATFSVRHPFEVATGTVTGTGRSRNDLSVQNVRGYIVNGGPDPTTAVINTGIPLTPPGVTAPSWADPGNIAVYLGPLTGGAYPGRAGFVTNAEGYNNGADGVLTDAGGNPVGEASLPLFDYSSPTGFGGVTASPYREFIPAGDTGDRQLGQGESAEATYKINAAAGDPTVSFIFALAGNYGNSAGPIATDPPAEKVARTRERRANPIYYFPGFNKPEALSMTLDTTNTTAGAAGASTPVDLYIDITDMQAGATLPASWEAWFNPANESAVRNVLPPDTSVVTERAGFSTVFTLGTPTPSGGGLEGILRGESPSLVLWDAPTKGGVQRISYMVIDNATGNIVVPWDAANDIEGSDIDPAGTGLPGPGQAFGVGSDADGATPAAPLKAHIQLATGASGLPAGSYAVYVVAYDDLIDDGGAPSTLFEESAWNSHVFQVTVNA
ncbi:MAG TPA: hypothetical protein VEI97_11260 [bacterium]|nr:hypothetical protein [bacterium]